MILARVPKKHSIESINYGLLYNWYVVDDVRDLSSTGWHVSNDNDLTILGEYVGSLVSSGGTYSYSNGYDLKLVDGSWTIPSIPTNLYGFNAVTSGRRFSDFSQSGSVIFIWSSESVIVESLTLSTAPQAFDTINIQKNFTLSARSYGKSIRLIKDSTTLTHGQTGTYTGNNGKIYRTICIGTQEWLADNLAETKYRNGDWIAGFDAGTYTPISDGAWIVLTTPALCAYNDDLNNV